MKPVIQILSYNEEITLSQTVRDLTHTLPGVGEIEYLSLVMNDVSPVRAGGVKSLTAQATRRELD